MLLAIGNQLNFSLCHLDVKTAFLDGQLVECVYLKPPEGVDVPDEYVLKLHKSLYGLSQSPRCWNIRFHNFIVFLGFVRSTSDYCLCVFVKGETRIYLVLYVDDMLICGSDQVVINNIKRQLEAEFDMKDLGEVRKFMGINSNIDRINGVLIMTTRDMQRKFLRNSTSRIVILRVRQLSKA